MMISIKNKSQNKLSGFLMAEAIFSVFITILVVIVLQSLIKSISSAQKIVSGNDDLAYSYIQLERFLNEKGTRTYTVPRVSNSESATFCKIGRDGEEKIYSIERYQEMVRVTTNHGGHMPLLLNVDKANFRTDRNSITIKLTEKDRRQSELVFKLKEKPKIRKERSNEKG